jgi:GMP synthase-like glutamine amidotransferase
MKPLPVRICLVDMNNGVANQATRCFRRLVESLKERAAAANPGLEVFFKHVQPRNLGELPDRDVDLVLSSGGPGSPYDGFEDPWCTGYRAFLDHVVERNAKDPLHAPRMLAICHSFELATIHLGVGRMRLRPEGRKFGVMPIYVTEEGRDSELLGGFGDRLFAFEHRNWEAVDLDPARLAQLGGRVLARESRTGRVDKGPALLAFDFAPGLCGCQFHPEADREGVLSWLNKPEQAADLKRIYGEALYDRMIKTLDDPTRVARTFALLVPGWLVSAFNHIARARGLRELEPPVQDASSFEAPQVAASA